VSGFGVTRRGPCRTLAPAVVVLAAILLTTIRLEMAMAEEAPAAPEPPAELPANAPRDFDALWNYGDPAATEIQFLEKLPAAREAGDAAYLAELLSQIARTHSLRKSFDVAHALLDEAEEVLPEGASVARARILLERGRTFNSARDPQQAVVLFTQALEAARAAGSDFHAVDAMHMLGIAEEPDPALAWNEKAIRAAEASRSARTRKWLGALYNNTGWTWLERGDAAKALDHFERNLAWRREHKVDDGIALWSVAKAQRHLGRVDEALTLQRDLAARHEAAGTTDGFVEEELGECLWALDRKDEARPHLARAYALLLEMDWVRTGEQARLRALHERGAVTTPLPEDLAPAPAPVPAPVPDETDGPD
jgi:tetratricopeptide (TPR) repeat protein